MWPALYRGATALAAPLIPLWLARRRAAGKEDAARLGERFGRAGKPRPAGRLVWLHAASVGESLSALPLLERLLSREATLTVLVTTGTVSSARLLAERLPERALHQYVPVDLREPVARFLAHWRPDLALWIESELWPSLVLATQARGVPMVLVNARLSPRSYRRWRWARGLIAAMLKGFALILTASDAEAGRLRALGGGRVVRAPNLKLAAPPLPVDEAVLDELRRRLGNRPVWLAASTHPGEELIAGRVHLALRPRLPQLLTLIVPRHPARGPALAQALAGLGLTVARRGAGETVEDATQVYLADTLGELGLFYRLAQVAFVGGSLARHGGQNPFEPARLGCPVLVGPWTANFAAAVETLVAAGGAETVADEAALGAAVEGLLRDEELRRRRGAAAIEAARGDTVLDQILGHLAPHLDRAVGGGGDAGA